ATCVFLIANYARLLAPFLPNTSAQILEWFGIQSADWESVRPHDVQVTAVNPLFVRMDKSVIDMERERLK
ncbi:MAG: methionine--tRNA ligase, partial [Bacilli bacterium]